MGASNTLQKSMQRSSSKRSSTADSPCSASSASPPKHLTPTLASFSSPEILSLHPSSLPGRASTSQRASRCPPLLLLRHLSLPVSASPPLSASLPRSATRTWETFPPCPCSVLGLAGFKDV